MTTIVGNNTPQYNLNDIPTARTIIEEAIQKINEAILNIWQTAIQDAQQLLSGKITAIHGSLEELQASIEPLQQLVSRNDELKKIEAQLQEERSKLRLAKEFEEAKAAYAAKAEELKKKILASRQAIRQAYEVFVSTVSAVNTPESNLEFEAAVHDKKQELFDAISGLFDNRNMRPFRDKYHSPVLDECRQCLPGVLNQKGIQEQICDILEGGRDAFELRRKKYIKT